MTTYVLFKISTEIIDSPDGGEPLWQIHTNPALIGDDEREAGLIGTYLMQMLTNLDFMASFMYAVKNRTITPQEAMHTVPWLVEDFELGGTTFNYKTFNCNQEETDSSETLTDE